MHQTVRSGDAIQIPANVPYAACAAARGVKIPTVYVIEKESRRVHRCLEAYAAEPQTSFATSTRSANFRFSMSSVILLP